MIFMAQDIKTSEQ